MSTTQVRFLRYPSAIAVLSCLALAMLLTAGFAAQPQQQTAWSDQEKPVLEKIKTLRKLPDDERARTTKELALQIRRLPAGDNKLRLAFGLAGLSTEGDFGHDTLQQVATTLAEALREHPVPAKPNEPSPYEELAELVRYEHVQVSLEDPQYDAALKQVDADEKRRENADFTLTDLQGKSWTLSALRGKVVLVNFWATWCPPCRKEMPDLNALYEQFKNQGFVVLAISDEERGKVQPYIEQYHYSYPILVDPGRKVHAAFSIEGIPKSFVFDREGKLVAQSIDMRTRGQFLQMLAEAGLK
jgi:peroxiredoxin